MMQRGCVGSSLMRHYQSTLLLTILQRMSLRLIVICAMLSQCLCSEKCSLILANWLVHPQNLQSEVYMNSGKFINDLGDYNNCLYNSDQYTYFTMRFVNKLVGLQYVGLCAPNECKQEIATNTYGLQMQNYLNELYMNKTGAKAGIFSRTTFYVPTESRPPIDWSNYCVIALISTIVILGIAGSILSKFTAAQSLPIKIIKCFSFVDNFAKITAVTKVVENQNLLFLNGMRVLSIFWIIFGHDMWFRFMNIKNWMETLDILTTPGLPTLVPAAYFAVDSFFWIGGFLVTIGLLDQIVKAKSYPKFYGFCLMHRFIRIWPTYMLAILIFWKIVPFLSSGPIWLSYSIFSSACSNGGIVWNMFFIDNFGNHGPSGMDYCFGWGWYLAVDFQLFLITPFIIMVYCKNRKIGWLVTFVLFLGSVVCAFVLIVVNDWRYPIPNPKMTPQPDFMDNFYYKPYVRASAYFMGIFAGFLYYQFKQGDEFVIKYVNIIKRSVPIRVAFYIFGITLCEFTIWIITPFQTGEEWSTTAQAFYNSLNRVVFLLGVYLCVFASIFGCENDPVRYILGHRMFAPLARVSFCIYLMHFVVIMTGTFSGRMDLYWEPYSAVYIVISDIFWSVIAATMLSLLVESPTLGLEKLMMGGGRKSKKQKEGPKKLMFEQAERTSIISSSSSSYSSVSSSLEANSQSNKSGELA